jgi:hypothetical protein
VNLQVNRRLREVALAVPETVDRYHTMGEMVSVRGLMDAGVKLVQIGTSYKYVLV